MKTWLARLAKFLAAWSLFAFFVGVGMGLAEQRTDHWQNGIQSYAEIVPSNEGSCVAEIRINNFPTDNLAAASGSLWLGDLHVGISYRLNVGWLAAERYTIYPPDGFVAVPSEIEVQDSGTGSVLICPFVGM